jgi:hypothetical protein
MDVTDKEAGGHAQVFHPGNLVVMQDGAVLDPGAHFRQVNPGIAKSLTGVENIVDRSIPIAVNGKMPALFRALQRNRFQLIGLHIGKTAIVAVEIWVSLQAREALVGTISDQFVSGDARKGGPVIWRDPGRVPNVRAKCIKRIGPDPGGQPSRLRCEPPSLAHPRETEPEHPG